MRVLDGFDAALARRLRAELDAVDPAAPAPAPRQAARRRGTAKTVDLTPPTLDAGLTEGSDLSRWLPI